MGTLTLRHSKMAGVLTGISLGLLIFFHLWVGGQYLLKVSPVYEPATILVGEGIPGRGETPVEKLLEGVFGCWYLSSIAAVLLTLKLGSPEAQKASLICPLLYHATISLFVAYSSTEFFNQDITTNRKAAVIHSSLALFVFYAYCTVGASTEEKKTN